MSTIIRERVEKMRAFMRTNGFNAFIVVSSDPHSSEYVADCWKSREWISGFDGSAGIIDQRFDFGHGIQKSAKQGKHQREYPVALLNLCELFKPTHKMDLSRLEMSVFSKNPVNFSA